jgi:hypothetical protein
MIRAGPGTPPTGSALMPSIPRNTGAPDAGESELVKKPGQPLIAHREPVTRGLVAESASDKTLAGTGRAQDQNVVVLVQPTAAGEAVDQAAVETARGAVVDILEAGGLAQPGKAQALGERGVVALDGLAIDQYRQALVEAEAITVGQALLLLERLGHAGEAQAAQRLDRGMDHDHSLLFGMASIGVPAQL